jgi:hypothetical protein
MPSPEEAVGFSAQERLPASGTESGYFAPSHIEKPHGTIFDMDVDQFLSLMDPPEEPQDPEAVARAAAARDAAWHDRYKKRAAEVEQQLVADAGQIGADHRLLLRLAAGEAVLAEKLGDLQAQLIERAIALVDKPHHVVTLAKAAKELMGTHVAISQRVESLLGTASVLRAQREMTQPRARLRVA